MAGGCHDDVLAEVRGGEAAASAAPAHYCGAFWESPLEDFIPADKTTAVFVEVVFHLLDEPRLKFVGIFESAIFHALFFCGVVFPLSFGAFIAADVDEFAWEDCHDFTEDIAAKLYGFFGGVEHA